VLLEQPADTLDVFGVERVQKLLDRRLRQASISCVIGPGGPGASARVWTE
jgi:hypothetical protein